ncbi:hypothetical protein K435DRAFT_881322 [Dendrothele bispora CBS 962.96]|uniref:Uncharacterized protein n=1 Tax=Dendrothele bispora (strain CBS 962.96) TaxID=1314807 RepID=A0A4S8KIF8_DENBC|nr:hypothetical protein K435DRAFT_881322 [Dendrothele bispora CBS 962.96]
MTMGRRDWSLIISSSSADIRPPPPPPPGLPPSCAIDKWFGAEAEIVVDEEVEAEEFDMTDTADPVEEALEALL